MKLFDIRIWYNNIYGLTGGRQSLNSSIWNNYVMLRLQYPQIKWKHLVQVYVAKTLIHIVDGISTVGRVLKWDIIVDTDCVLCHTNQVDIFDHPFYTCPYSAYVWTTILNWLRYHRQLGSLDFEVTWIISKVKNSRPRAGIVGFCFAATIYNIWT